MKKITITETDDKITIEIDKDFTGSFEAIASGNKISSFKELFESPAPIETTTPNEDEMVELPEPEVNCRKQEDRPADDPGEGFYWVKHNTVAGPAWTQEPIK